MTGRDARPEKQNIEEKNVMSYKILVIDDDEGVRELLNDLLLPAGYEVALAKDGNEGIRIFSESGADLVITDIIMPEKEGLETIMELKRSSSDVKIFAISGGSRNLPIQFLDASKNLGALRTFKKPFDCQELLKAVKEVLGG